MHKSVILLTGATGFLGSHLLEVLIGKGHPVVVLKRSTSSLWRIKHLAGKYKSYNIDLVSVESIFNNNNIEIYSLGECVIIQGQDVTDFRMLNERLAYGLLEVIE